MDLLTVWRMHASGIVGKCPACGGTMVREVDDEGREWGNCLLCRARTPLKSGFVLVKSQEKSCS